LGIKPSKVFVRIAPVWKNMGATRTKKLRMYASVLKTAHPIGPDYDFAIPEGVEFVPRSLGPGATALGSPVDIWGVDLIEAKEGRAHFYVWGVAFYRDVLAGTPVRYTRYCHKLEVNGNPKLMPSEKNIVEVIFAAFGGHNTTEDDG